MSNQNILEKKLERALRAQEEAESLLEQKSKELYELNSSLEKQINVRTKELQAATETAVNSNKAKSQFLANMSHEIRTPLNGMLGFIGLLEKSHLTKNQKEQLSVVSKSSQLLLSIINDVLEFSKIEAGKLVLEKRSFHLKRCIEDIADVMSHQAYEKGLELPVYLDENIPKFLVGDESRIRQVLLNLIGNAIKFTPTGEVCLSVRAQGFNEKGECEIYFEVKDSGVGISHDKIKKIFIAFEQADVSDTRRYGGTGLGLTISKEIVEAYGGALNVDSIESIGTTFYFTIPLGVAESESVEYTTRNFRNTEAVAVVISNNTIKTNLVDRLNRWNVNTKIFDNIDDIDWNFSNGAKKNIIVDYFFVSGESDRSMLEQQIKSGIHIMVVAPPEIKASLLEDFSALKIDLLTKPVKREDLFKSINEKRISSDEIKQQKENSEANPVLSSENKNATAYAKKFLLVEDNLVNQQVAIAMLEAHGYTADVAGNGREALELYSKNKYELILMDCQMPIMDGFESTRLLRKLDANVIIIAMTANALKQTKEKCFEVGMNDFVTKPINDDQLADVVRRNLLKAKIVA